MHYASVIRLNDEIAAIQDVMLGLFDVTDLDRARAVVDEIAVLKGELASLRMERKAFLNDL